MRKLIIAALALLSLEASAYQYDITPDDNLQLYGYAGYKQLFSNAEISSTFDGKGKPELGLNIIYNHNNFQIFNQFRYGKDSGTYLVYNFAQYVFNVADNVDVTLKGGKLRHEFGLYNTTRVNPKTRQGVIQPQAIYWDGFDETLTSGTGVGIAVNAYDLELGFTIDDPTIVDSKKSARIVSSGILNTMDNRKFGDHMIAYLNYLPKSLPLVIKSSYMQMNIGDDYSVFGQRVLPKDITSQDFIFSAMTFGFEYAFEDFILSGETMWFRTPIVKWHDLGEMTKGFSVTGTYHVSSELDLRLNYNEYDSASGRRILPATPWISYAKDLNVGVNYHTGPWMFQVEGHYINGAKTVDRSDWQQDPTSYQQWWMIGTNFIYSF